VSTTPNTPTETLPDDLILAAIDRAERHRHGAGTGVLFARAVEHLGLRSGAWTTRRTRPQFEALENAGMVERLRRQGLVAWTLTGHGRRHLANARAAGTLPALPEAPQHITWREARTAAAQRIDEFREGLPDVLAEALATLNATRPAESEEWFDLAARLQHACWLLGSASYCLNEWAEPTDTQADTDEPTAPGDEVLTPIERSGRRAQRAGRREINRWKDSMTPRNERSPE
jgi:hypothetical protein